MKNIRQNLFLAFVYNAVGVPVAAGVLYPFIGVLVSPIWASAAMTFSSVSVIVNALRLRRARALTVRFVVRAPGREAFVTAGSSIAVIAASAPAVTSRSPALSVPSTSRTACSTVPRRRALTRTPDGCQPEHGGPTVFSVRRPFQQALVDQPSQHAGQGARVDMEHAQLAGRHAWKQSDGADHQPLGPGYADCQEHLRFRRPLQRVHQRPQHPHELQHIRQIVRRAAAAPGPFTCLPLYR